MFTLHQIGGIASERSHSVTVLTSFDDIYLETTNFLYQNRYKTPIIW